MTLGYRSLLFASALEELPTTQAAEESFRAWLAGKGYDASAMVDGQVDLSDDAQVMRVTHLAPDGTRTIRLRLAEENSGGRWVSTLTASDPGDSILPSWYWLDVDSKPPAGEAPPVGVKWTAAPRLSRDLLSKFDSSDGAVRLGGAPVVISADQVDALFRSIIASDRRSPVLVAACPTGVRSEVWAAAVAKITRETQGLGATFSLGPEEVAALNQRLGGSFQVIEGTVRTYLPNIRLNAPADSRRHRYLTTARIIEAIDRPNAAARALGWGVRIATLNQPLPYWARHADRVLTELEPSVRLRAIEQGSTRSADLGAEPEPVSALPDNAPQTGRTEQIFVRATGSPIQDETSAERVLQLIKLGLDIEEAQRQMTSQVAFLQDRFEQQAVELEALRTVKEDVEIDLAQASEDALKDQDLIRTLRIALTKHGDGEAAWAELDESSVTTTPSDFQELFEWSAKHLKYVTFTGERAHALELETHDALNQWPATTWSHLLALDDYARSKVEGVFSGSFYDYLTNTPVGYRNMPRTKFSAQESDTVSNNQQMSRLRMLPVPADVDESGFAFMAAHTKIASFATISPRMHFLDDVSSSAKVYVGYIGRHLRTNATN